MQKFERERPALLGLCKFDHIDIFYTNVQFSTFRVRKFESPEKIWMIDLDNSSRTNIRTFIARPNRMMTILQWTFLNVPIFVIICTSQIETSVLEILSLSDAYICTVQKLCPIFFRTSKVPVTFVSLLKLRHKPPI